jgi:hypothetical protein
MRCVASIFWLILVVSRLLAQEEACTPLRPLSSAAEPVPVFNRVEYIYVVDSTGSMNYRIPRSGRTRWQELRDRLVESVTAIPTGRGHRLHLLVFGATVDRNLNWSSTPQNGRLDGTNTSATVVDFTSDAEKNQVLNLIRVHSPNAPHTALVDAIAAGYDRAIFLQGQDEGCRIVITVFSDGDDNFSSRFKPYNPTNTFEGFEREAKRRLGACLVNSNYLFIQVAGVNVRPPTPAPIVSRTPILASVSLEPQSIEAGSLSASEETDFVEVLFDITALKGKAFPVYFEPLPPGASKPQVRVVCEAGKPAVFSAPGTYRIKFRRLGPASDYEKGFEGLLKMDLGDYANRAVDDVRLSRVSKDVRVRFAGVARAEVLRGEIKPADGTRVLVGNALKFEAPPRAGAKYHWTFTGADESSAEGAVVERVFGKAGTVAAALQIVQPGFVIAPVKISVEVVDPQLKFTVTSREPVEGEKVGVRLESNPALKVKDVRWLPQPDSVAEGTAAYEFTGRGEKTVSVLVATDLGQAAAATVLNIGPGVPPPQLIIPQVMQSADGEAFTRLYNQSEPQRLEAEVGEAVQGVLFSLMQNGHEIMRQTGKVLADPGRRVARVDFMYPPELHSGDAALTLVAIPKDPSLNNRLGERKSVYRIEVSQFAFAIIKKEPVSSDLLWDTEAGFVVELGGAGASKVTGLEWRVEQLNPSGQVIPIKVLDQKRDEFNSDEASFSFPVELADGRLQALKGDSWLRVTAIPQGDKNVIAGQAAVWDGMRPKLLLADFVIQAPGQVSLDDRISVSVVDRRSGNKVESVTWEAVGEDGNPLSGLSAPSVTFETHKPGPHAVRATVTWGGPPFRCGERMFFVAHEPFEGNVMWNGVRKPVLRERGKPADAVATIQSIGRLRGSRVSVSVNVKRVAGGKAGGSLPGWPRTFQVAEVEKGFGVPWPPTTLKVGSEYSVEIHASGFDSQGFYSSHIRQLGTFSMVNLPPIPWPWIIGVSMAALALCGGTYWLTHMNEGKWYAFVTTPSRRGIQEALRALDSENLRDVPPSELMNKFRNRLAEIGRTDAEFNAQPRDGRIEDGWKGISWWTKRAAVSLKDDNAFPTNLRAERGWPAWLGADGFLKFGRQKHSGNHISLGAYQDCGFSKLLSNYAFESVEIVDKPLACKQVLKFNAEGQPPVYLVVWDLSGDPEPRRKLRNLKMVGWLVMAPVILGCAGFLQQAFN